jgi:PAS domain S-box-containing protein
MGLGAKIRTRLASLSKSPIAIAAAAIALFMALFLMFSRIEVWEHLLAIFDRLEIYEIDKALLAGFIVVALLAAAGYWEIRRRSADIQHSRDLLQTALDSLRDGAALFDRNERLVFWNEGFIRTSPALREIVAPGLSFTELVTRMMAQGRYLGVDRNWVETRVRQFRALEPVENHIRDPDGKERWAYVHLHRTRDGGTFLIREDITERKQSEAELATVRQRLADAIDSISDGVALFDKDERLVMYNQSYHIAVSRVVSEFRIGMTFEEEIRSLHQRGFYVDAGDDWIPNRLRAFRALDPVEYQSRDILGNDLWIKVHHYRTRDGGTLLIREDTTAGRKAEADLKSSRDLLQTARQRLVEAFTAVTDGIALFDKDERLVQFNGRYAAETAALGEMFKPGLTFENMVRALAGSGYYGAVDEGWIQQRLRRFRAREDAEYAVTAVDGGPGWRVVRQFRTADGGTLVVVNDITARRKAEAELESSRQLLQTALDTVAGGIALFDKDERLVLYNEGLARNLKSFSGALAPGIRFDDFVKTIAAGGGYEDTSPDWIAERVRKFRDLEPVELHRCDPDGSERWHLVRHYRTRDGGTLRIGTDITERKRAEAALEASQHLLQVAIDSIAAGVALYDKDERLVLFNEGYARGLSIIGDILKPGLSLRDEVTALVRHGNYLDVGEEWIEERIRLFRSLDTALSRQRGPAGDRWISSSHYRTRDGGTFLVRADITENKRMEEQLRSTQGLLLAALENMKDGFALFDKHERLALFNQQFARFPTMMRDVIKIGLPFATMAEAVFERGGFIGKDRDWLERRIQCFRTLEPIEVLFRDADGHERWFNFTHHRTREGGTLMVREDITDQMHALGEVERARSIAEQANETKTKFLASMSHELRTPLNAILGFAQMVELGIGKMPEAQTREYLAIVLKSGQHLLDLLSNILEFAKFESQGEPRTFIAMSSVDLSRQCVDMVREEAKARGVAIVNDAGTKETEARFVGDPLWARQILLNLLVNAVKYNQPGGTATVTCTRRPDGRVRIAVADTGIGIPQEIQDRVFEPFQRLGREAGQIEGAGIGLALSRQLTLRMGGEIGFESVPHKGSTFWFDLPAVEDEVERVA